MKNSTWEHIKCYWVHYLLLVMICGGIGNYLYYTIPIEFSEMGFESQVDTSEVIIGDYYKTYIDPTFDKEAYVTILSSDMERRLISVIKNIKVYHWKNYYREYSKFLAEERITFRLQGEGSLWMSFRMNIYKDTYSTVQINGKMYKIDQEDTEKLLKIFEERFPLD